MVEGRCIDIDIGVGGVYCVLCVLCVLCVFFWKGREWMGWDGREVEVEVGKVEGRG